MGQTSSLHVRLERETYSPAELVRGAVCFKVSEAIDTDALVLRIVGEERAKWNESDSSRRGNTYRGHTKLVEHETTLHDKGTVEPGAYEFPFQFVLPATLPGSLDWDADKCAEPSSIWGRASIRYFIQAMCIRPGMLQQNITSDSLTFKLLPPICSVPYTGPAEVKDSQTLMSCFCFSKGSISGSLVMPTNVAHVGSELVIKAQLQNQTSALIRKVRVHLLQRVALKTNSVQFGGQTLSRCQPGFITYVSAVDDVNRQGALQPGSATPLECQVPLPKDILPSFFGQHVQIEYVVELVAKMGGGLSDFKLNAPIVISCTPPNKSMDATAPSLALPYPPMGTVPPYPPVLPGANGGEEASPCYSYPPMDTPHDWHPIIQKTVFVDLGAPQPATKTKWGDRDDSDDGEECYSIESEM